MSLNLTREAWSAHSQKNFTSPPGTCLPTADISCRNPLNGHSYLAEFSGVNTRSLPVAPDNRVLGTQKRRGAAGKKTEDFHICILSARTRSSNILFVIIYLYESAADLKSADLYRSWGFKSPSGHHKMTNLFTRHPS
jgi:hypothetical protein